MAKLGGKGGHLSPGAAFWGYEIEVRILRNNYEISADVIITIYKMVNANGCYPVVKSHQDHQGSLSEQ